MTTRSHGWLMALWLLAGCGDSTGGAEGPADGGADPTDAGAGRADTGQPDVPDTGPEVEGDADLPAGPAPAYVALALSPRQAVYRLADRPLARATVFDRGGHELPGVALRFDVQPPDLGRVAADGTVELLAEGPGAVRACTAAGLCGRATIFVDDAAPALEVSSPARGALVQGEPLIEVRGTATGGAGVRVYVNDREVALQADGSFTAEVAATFGFNRLDVVADDGVHRPPARVVREVVWAPVVVPATAQGIAVPQAVVLRLAQPLLDGGNAPAPAPPAGMAGELLALDVAGAVEAFLALAEPLNLVPDPVLAAGEPLDLRVEAIRPGVADAALTLTDTGLEVFLRIDGLEIDTRGSLVFEANTFDLTGTVRVSAAAFARLALETGPGGAPRLRIETADVAVEALGGRMDDSTAQAVLDTFGSLLRTVLDGFAHDLVDDLVREQVPEFLELGLDDVLDTLRLVPLDVTTVEGAPPIALDLAFALSAPTATPRDALTLGLDGAVRPRAPGEAPHPDPGVPSETALDDAAPPWPASAGLAVGARLLLVNALLHEAWRQGALSLDATTVLPPEIAGLIDGVRLDARVAPLVVGSAPGSPSLFELQVGELDLFATGPQRAMPDHYVLSIRAGLVLEAMDGRVRFDVADDPDIRVELVEAGGDLPLVRPEGLAVLLEAVAWPKLRESIGEGLDLTLEETHVGTEAYATLAPRLLDLRVVPTFPVAPLVRRGWLVLSAGVEARLAVGP